MNKKVKLIPSIIAIILTLSSCSGQNTNLQEEDMALWQKTAKLNAQETPEELYKAALNENTLVIFSTTTRVLNVKKSFETKYPGLTVEVQDVRAYDLNTALKKNFKERQYTCDIAICTDCDTSLSRDLIPNGVLYKYVPYDISDKLLPGHNTDQLEFLGEGTQVFYNSEVYKKSPVTNWWELTEPRFVGRVCMSDPLRSNTAFALVCAIIQNSDSMADAYQQLYGKNLIIPEGSSAGKIFLQKLVENNILFVNSSDEVVEMVGAKGQTDPPIGIMISSKVRMDDIGLDIAPVFDIQPSSGVYAPCSIMIAGGSKNVNAAKLFIRWILGESDGTGDGYTPYLQKGTWSVRSDVKSKSTISLEQANFWRIDKEYVAENKEDIMAFWLSLQK